MGSGDKCNQTGCDNPAAFRDAFGAPAKDNLREEFEKHWANLPRWVNKEYKEASFEAFKQAREESPKGFIGTGPDINQIQSEIKADTDAKKQWHGKKKGGG